MIIGYFNNQDSENLVSELINKDILFLKILYAQKNKLIMSSQFLNSLSEEAKKTLLQNEELDEFNLSIYLHLQEVFSNVFNKPEKPINNI